MKEYYKELAFYIVCGLFVVSMGFNVYNYVRHDNLSEGLNKRINELYEVAKPNNIELIDLLNYLKLDIIYEPIVPSNTYSLWVPKIRSKKQIKEKQIEALEKEIEDLEDTLF